MKKILLPLFVLILAVLSAVPAVGGSTTGSAIVGEVPEGYARYVGVVSGISIDDSRFKIYDIEKNTYTTFTYNVDLTITKNGRQFKDFVLTTGDIVEIIMNTNDSSLTITPFSDAWTVRTVTDLNINSEDETVIIGGDRCKYSAKTVFENEWAFNNSDAEQLVIACGIGDNIWYIAVIPSFGYAEIVGANHIINGAVTLKSGATVYIEELDNMDGQQIPLKAGTYTAEVTGDNINPTLIEYIRVTAGETEEINLSICKVISGRLNLTVDPVGAAVTIDGADYDINKPGLLEFGRHTMWVSMDGYITKEDDFYFSYDSQGRDISLDKVEGDEPPPPEPFNWGELVLVLGGATVVITILVFLVRYALKHHKELKLNPPSDTAATSTEGKPNSQAIITAVNVASNYSGNVAAKSFTINRGDLIYIIGESGAGKTVLLKILGGYDKNPQGKLTFHKDNKSYTWEKDDKVLKEMIGYVPQDAILYENISPMKLLGYYNKLFDRNLKESEIHEILLRLGTETDWDNRIGKLSGGEQKRVSLAVELLKNPDILLLDEPDSGLDPASRELLYKQLYKAVNEGTTVILSTHIQCDAFINEKLEIICGDGKMGLYRRKQVPNGSI